MNAQPHYTQPHTLSGDRAQSAEIDFLWTIYRWMSIGLAVTGVVAYAVASSPEAMQLVYGNPILRWGSFAVILGGAWMFPNVAQRVSTPAAAGLFALYAAAMGVSLSWVFIAYTQSSVADVFFITAGSFGALSFYGTVTKRDLSGVGRFMFMGLIGLILASVVNIFLNNPAIYWITTYAGVLIFAGLTAYNTQKLRDMYRAQGAAGNLALIGALILYIDFINLFLYLLRLFGDRRN